MNWVRDLLQAIFFSISSLALIVGGTIALWRFVLQRPFGPAWDVVLPSECHVRRTGEDRYVYEVVVEILNLSVLPQRPVRNWMALSFPGEDAFDAVLPPIRRPEDADEHITKTPATSLSSVSAGSRRQWVHSDVRFDLYHAVRFKLAFETRRRMLLGVLRGDDFVMTHGAATIPVAAEDIRLYSDLK